MKNVSQEPHTLHANEDKLIRDLEYGRAVLGRKKTPNPETIEHTQCFHEEQQDATQIRQCQRLCKGSNT